MAPLISSSVKGRDGAGHTASPLGQPAPLAQTNPQANPHQTRGSTRVSRSAHILPRTRPHRVFSTVRISSPCRRRDRESLLHPVGTASCLAGAASYPAPGCNAICIDTAPFVTNAGRPLFVTSPWYEDIVNTVAGGSFPLLSSPLRSRGEELFFSGRQLGNWRGKRKHRSGFLPRILSILPMVVI
jgi:hypothetical protein